ncbi:MAG: hypothetical protein DA328_03210 [Nitrososphaeraceae archaeon]|nr:hypothetical protein [Nitrososphaeraceae archaeon]
MTIGTEYNEIFSILLRPAGITLDAADKVYIVDSGNNRIQKFTADGNGW